MTTNHAQPLEPPRRILIAEDEPILATTLRHRLEACGYVVEVASEGEQTLRLAREPRFDLAILDIALPLRTGLEVCRVLRSEGSKLPIVMLTARVQVEDRIHGLDSGADDYLTKPFEMNELLARIRAVLRRTEPVSVAAVDPDLLDGGPIRVDLRSSRAFKQDRELELSALEFRLLRYFIEHRGALISREELLDRVWAYNAGTHTRTVDAHVASLRQKVEDIPARPQLIVTVHRLGYRYLG
jgi:DNA-binding response OmpR family regulator